MCLITLRDIADIKKTFAQFDANNDGSISMDELEAAMRQCGKNPSKLEVKILMNQVDTDRKHVRGIGHTQRCLQAMARSH